MKVRPAPSYIDNLPGPRPGPPRDWGVGKLHYFLFIVPNAITVAIVVWFGCQDFDDKSDSVTIILSTVMLFFVNTYLQILSFCASLMALDKRQPVLFVPIFIYLIFILLLLTGTGAFYGYCYHHGYESVFHWNKEEANNVIWLVALLAAWALWAVISLISAWKVRRNMIKQLDEEGAEYTRLFSA